MHAMHMQVTEWPDAAFLGLARTFATCDWLSRSVPKLFSQVQKQQMLHASCCRPLAQALKSIAYQSKLVLENILSVAHDLQRSSLLKL